LENEIIENQAIIESLEEQQQEVVVQPQQQQPQQPINPMPGGTFGDMQMGTGTGDGGPAAGIVGSFE
ncbi:MAG: hypothetical protein NC307_14515, partial [Roseburia sp.]|nr:hypothetical protein [Roseburia sp.]